ncbi:MAG: putative signal transduction protein containing a rane domain, an and a domain [Frankiales bacterium]|nr:putative signal transduction protein containing a rane domain, an and a domain [Frankiales bacterium]
MKIDRSFVSGPGSGGADASIIRAILSMAHGLGLQTTGEGVETVEQARILTELGCDRAQGYLWSPPVAASTVTPAVSGERPERDDDRRSRGALTGRRAPDDDGQVVQHRWRAPGPVPPVESSLLTRFPDPLQHGVAVPDEQVMTTPRARQMEPAISELPSLPASITFDHAARTVLTFLRS